MSTRRLLEALAVAAIAVEVYALATGQTTVTDLGRELTRTPAGKAAGLYLAWHILAEADVRDRVRARRELACA